MFFILRNINNKIEQNYKEMVIKYKYEIDEINSDDEFEEELSKIK